MTDCQLCKQEIKGYSLNCSKGGICMVCAKDISHAEYQPAKSLNEVMWVLAETYCRRGKGEEVTFEGVWDSNSRQKLVKFEELFPQHFISKGGKNGKN